MFVNGSGQNDQSLERTFDHRCFLPGFISFGWGVSEKKIKMWKVNRRRTPSNGKSSHCLWQGELMREKWYKRAKTFDCKLKSIDSWIEIIPVVFCDSYNVPSLILKSLKEVFKQVWFFPKTLPTMVHGKAFHITNWQLLSRGPFYLKLCCLSPRNLQQ